MSLLVLLKIPPHLLTVPRRRHWSYPTTLPLPCFVIWPCLALSAFPSFLKFQQRSAVKVGQLRYSIIQCPPLTIISPLRNGARRPGPRKCTRLQGEKWKARGRIGGRHIVTNWRRSLICSGAEHPRSGWTRKMPLLTWNGSSVFMQR